MTNVVKKSYRNSLGSAKVGRPKEFDEDVALMLAMNYFWDKGYDNASLSQLLKEMKISKSSFYQTYNSKQALFERCLSLYTKHQSEWVKEQLKEKSAVMVLDDFLQVSMIEFQQFGEIRGCLLMNSAQVCYKKHPDLSLLIQYQFKAFHKLFEQLIRSGQQSGDISSRHNASMLSSIYINTLNGLSIMIKAGADDKIIQDVLQGFNLQLK